MNHLTQNFSTFRDWSFEHRHKWMQERLRYKRQIQSGANVAGFYNLLLDNFFSYTSGGSSVSSHIMEILSEGFWEKDNPAWAGLSVTEAGISTVEGGAYQELSESVKANRDDSSPNLTYKTHLEIGDHLIEPSLFKVTANSVEYYDYVQWRELTDSSKPLLLKPESEVNELQSLSQAENQESPPEDIAESLSGVIDHTRLKAIEESLLQLSRDVLWQAFFPPENYPADGERISLIFIQASARRSVGVWALHAFDPHSPINATKEAATIYSTITPPILCLTETLMNLYKLEGTDQHRIRDVHLFQRCCGRRQEYEPGREDDDYIYNNSFDSDPFVRFRRIYDKACLHYQSDFKFNSDSFDTGQDTQGSLIYQLDEIFVHLFVAFAIAEFKQTISHVTLRDALQKGLNLLMRCESASTQINELKSSRIIEEFKGRLQDSYEGNKNGFTRDDCLTVLTFTASLLACVVLNSEKTPDASRLGLLSSRIAVLAQLFSEDERIPSLNQYQDWHSNSGEASKTDSLRQALSAAGIPEPAVWIITQLNRSANEQ